MTEQPVSEVEKMHRSLLCLAVAIVGPFVFESLVIVAVEEFPEMAGLLGGYTCWGLVVLPAILAIWLAPWHWGIRAAIIILYLPLLGLTLLAYAFFFIGVVYDKRI